MSSPGPGEPRHARLPRAVHRPERRDQGYRPYQVGENLSMNDAVVGECEKPAKTLVSLASFQLDRM